MKSQGDHSDKPKGDTVRKKERERAKGGTAAMRTFEHAILAANLLFKGVYGDGQCTLALTSSFDSCVCFCT